MRTPHRLLAALLGALLLSTAAPAPALATTTPDLGSALTRAVEAPEPYDLERASADDGLDSHVLIGETFLRSGDWSYTVTDGEALICGYYGSATDITIPSAIAGYPVTSIQLSYDGDANAITSITSVVIPKTVTALGHGAFQGFTNLRSITFEPGSQCTQFTDRCFAGTAITSFTFPDSLIYMGTEVFGGCTNLTTVTFNKAITEFKQRVPLWLLDYDERFDFEQYGNPFVQCPNLTTINLNGNTNFRVQNGGLYNADMTALYGALPALTGTSFSVPSSVREIAAYAFAYNDALTSVTLSEGLQIIGDSTFMSSGITSLTVPNSVITIRADAARSCTSLRTVTIGSGVKELGGDGGTRLFYGCSNLTSLTLGPNVQRIRSSAFAETGLTSVHLPDSVTRLDFGAFGNCYSLTTVTGGTNLETIETAAFQLAPLTSFPFGDRLVLIEKDAFVASGVSTASYPSYLEATATGDYVRYAGRLGFSGTDQYAYAYQVLDSVNSQRKANGLGTLTMDKELLECAMQRAAELCMLFDHDRPTGGNCFTITAKACGENIAAGYPTPTAVMNGWMNSSGHRANILDSDYTSIGVGCFENNGTLYWVQLFGMDTAETVSKPADKSTVRTVPFMTAAYGGTEPRLSLSASSSPTVGGTVSFSCLNSSNGWASAVVAPSTLTWSTNDANKFRFAQEGVAVAATGGTGTFTASVTGTNAYQASTKVTFKAPTSSSAPAGYATDQTPSGVSVGVKCHVQTYGWQGIRYNGSTAGTTGSAKRVEGFVMSLANQDVPGSIQVSSHVQSIGWQNFVDAGRLSGTSGQSKRVEAIKVKLTGQMADKYDVWYRTHCEKVGWTGWAKNGDPCGTAGMSRRMEAVEVKLTPKNAAAPGSTESPYHQALVSYRTHVQTFGWQGYVFNGETSGTTGKAKRLEGINIKLVNAPVSGAIQYRTHVQTYGWEKGWKTNGGMSGTSGEAKRLEAIQIKLTGKMEEQYNVWYRVHCQTFGWTGWASNGQECGSAGYAKRLEGIQIQVLPKSAGAPGSTENCFYQK